jgi:hypothetical protein
MVIKFYFVLFYVNTAMENSEIMCNRLQFYKIYKPITEVFVHQYMSLNHATYHA